MSWDFVNLKSVTMAARKHRVSLVWFKNYDLRLHDHEPITRAHQESDFVIHLMVIDNFWFFNKTRELGIQKTGAYRCKFLKEAILDLRGNLNRLNSQLIIRFGVSSDIIASIVDYYSVDTVYLHDELHSEEQTIVKLVIRKCKRMTNNRVKFKSFWGGNTLYHADDLPFFDKKKPKKIPHTWRSFRRAAQNQGEIKNPIDPLSACKPHPYLLSQSLCVFDECKHYKMYEQYQAMLLVNYQACGN